MMDFTSKKRFISDQLKYLKFKGVHEIMIIGYELDRCLCFGLKSLKLERGDNNFSRNFCLICHIEITMRGAKNLTNTHVS